MSNFNVMLCDDMWADECLCVMPHMWSVPRLRCLNYSNADMFTSPSSLFCVYILSHIAMPPSITSEKITLTYPIFGAAFIDGNHLLVGGGGGEGRSGVGNKIVRIPSASMPLKNPPCTLFTCYNVVP